jgi:ABC-type multidrug transport system fused ATPase/permease subunit
MHDGKIVEAGTHEELLELGGRYYSLWQKQISGKKD